MTLSQQNVLAALRGEYPLVSLSTSELITVALVQNREELLPELYRGDRTKAYARLDDWQLALVEEAEAEQEGK